MLSSRRMQECYLFSKQVSWQTSDTLIFKAIVYVASLVAKTVKNLKEKHFHKNNYTQEIVFGLLILCVTLIWPVSFQNRRFELAHILDWVNWLVVFRPWREKLSIL